jgi:uncharacterized protein (DUF849 family)
MLGRSATIVGMAGRSRAHVPHPLRPYDGLIINAAINGMVPRRAGVPHVPVTPAQIVEDAVACVDAGAAILHVHARHADESPAWEREVHAELIPAIRALRPEAVICVSTSGREVADVDRSADVLDLTGDAKPDMASLSLNLGGGPSVNAPDTIVALAERMAERGIRPELEIFDSGMAYLAHRARRQPVDGRRAPPPGDQRGPRHAHRRAGSDRRPARGHAGRRARAAGHRRALSPAALS